VAGLPLICRSALPGRSPRAPNAGPVLAVDDASGERPCWRPSANRALGAEDPRPSTHRVWPALKRVGLFSVDCARRDVRLKPRIGQIFSARSEDALRLPGALPGGAKTSAPLGESHAGLFAVAGPHRNRSYRLRLMRERRKRCQRHGPHWDRRGVRRRRRAQSAGSLTTITRAIAGTIGFFDMTRLCVHRRHGRVTSVDESLNR
jgi:hypothetical protein